MVISEDKTSDGNGTRLWSGHSGELRTVEPSGDTEGATGPMGWNEDSRQNIRHGTNRGTIQKEAMIPCG
jgi:hypothetical protein